MVIYNLFEINIICTINKYNFRDQEAWVKNRPVTVVLYLKDSNKLLI